MKKWLVDVPVKINIWIREECQRKQFEVIKEVRPKTLFIVSDGGRTEEEWAIINNNRLMYEEEIDWECEIFRLYESSNQGMYNMILKIHDFVWDKVDRCVYLEDDIIPSTSFFYFCEEMLTLYHDDKRIFAVCGMNHLGVYQDCSSDYFFSRYGSIWGIAYWKRSYEEYFNFAYRDDSYSQRLLRGVTKEHPAHWKQIESIIQTGEYDGHIPGDEYYMNAAVYSQHQLFIIPKKNMIKNIGCQKNASHGDSLDMLPKGVRSLFEMDTYDVEFPLSDPKYVIPDISYEKKRNRIMGLDHPLVSTYRKFERSFLILKKEGLSKLIKKIKRRAEKEK